MSNNRLRDDVRAVGHNLAANYIAKAVEAVIALSVIFIARSEDVPLHLSIIYGVGVAFIVAVMAYVIRLLFSPLGQTTHAEDNPTEKWLREIAEKDKREVERMVYVFEIERTGLSFEPPKPFIIFNLRVFNGSLFPITIEPKPTGFIKYAGRRLAGEITMSTKWEVKNLPRGWNAKIELHQWLTQEDADFINHDPNAPNNFFDLGQVSLTITGGEPFYDVVAQRPLKIDGGVDMSGNML
jgi:hypothetical protein